MSNALASNIRKIRESAGLKQDEFAEQLGTTQGTVSRWERGARPDFKFLHLIAQFGKTTIEELSGPGMSVEEVVTEALDRAGIRDSEIVQIQKLDLSLSMGPGTLIDDWVEAEPVSFDLAFIRAITRSPPGRLKLVAGIGDSMYPTLNWGDAILVDTTDHQLSKQDGIYWINLFGAAGIKRLRTIGPGRVLVKSDNPTVDDQEVDLKDLRIEGRAVWFARGL